MNEFDADNRYLQLSLAYQLSSTFYQLSGGAGSIFAVFLLKCTVHVHLGSVADPHNFADPDLDIN
jgi:hypothetical protein